LHQAAVGERRGTVRFTQDLDTTNRMATNGDTAANTREVSVEFAP